MNGSMIPRPIPATIRRYGFLLRWTRPRGTILISPCPIQSTIRLRSSLPSLLRVFLILPCLRVLDRFPFSLLSLFLGLDCLLNLGLNGLLGRISLPCLLIPLRVTALAMGSFLNNLHPNGLKISPQCLSTVLRIKLTNFPLITVTPLRLFPLPSSHNLGHSSKPQFRSRRRHSGCNIGHSRRHSRTTQNVQYSISGRIMENEAISLIYYCTLPLLILFSVIKMIHFT